MIMQYGGLFPKNKEGSAKQLLQRFLHTIELLFRRNCIKRGFKLYQAIPYNCTKDINDEKNKL